MFIFAWSRYVNVFNFPYICIYICFQRIASRRLSILPNLQTNVWKIRKIKWTSSSQATSFKLGECNLLPSILTLRLWNCAKFTFRRSYLLSDSHTNTVISDRFAYPSRWRRKPCEAYLFDCFFLINLFWFVYLFHPLKLDFWTKRNEMKPPRALL